MFGSRKNAGTGRKAKSEGRALALIPVGIAFLFAAVALPRAVVPAEAPLPRADMREVQALLDADTARARMFATTPLPSSVRAVGSAMREFLAAQAEGAPDEVTAEAHKRLVNALTFEKVTDGVPALADLRAVLEEELVARVAEASALGRPRTRDLDELAGPIVRRFTDVGLADGTRLQLSAVEQKVFYRALFNATLDLGEVPAFLPTLDEQRVRYAVLLGRGHPGESELRQLSQIPVIALATGEAETEEARCARIESSEALTLAAWRLAKAREIGKLDPAYPTMYAVGLLAYQHRDYDASVNALRVWLDQHPQGEWSTRAENILRAGLAASAKAI